MDARECMAMGAVSMCSAADLRHAMRAPGALGYLPYALPSTALTSTVCKMPSEALALEAPSQAMQQAVSVSTLVLC